MSMSGGGGASEFARAGEWGATTPPQVEEHIRSRRRLALDIAVALAMREFPAIMARKTSCFGLHRLYFLSILTSRSP
jgi:hypothetical protein